MRKRRYLWRGLGIGALLAGAGLVLAWPIVLRLILGGLLEPEWGGPASIRAASWALGDRIVLHGAEASDDAGAALTVARIELRFERAPLLRAPGRLLAADFLDGVLTWRGRSLGTVAAVRYRRQPDGSGPALAIEGLDGRLAVAAVADWIGLIDRITSAPGVAGDGSGPMLQEIRIIDSALAVEVPADDAPPQRLPLAPFDATLRPIGPHSMAVESITGELFGGQLLAHGEVDWHSADLRWHAQVNLQRLDLAAVGGQLDWLPASSAGSVTCFLDVGSTSNARLGGAGWLEGSDVAVWEQPVAREVLQHLGVRPERTDTLEQVRARVLLDRGRIYFEQLVALGTPVNLFGNGSMQLDGTDLVAGLVPRFRAQKLSEIPLDQSGPRDLLFDVLKGALMELRVEGSLDGVSVFVQPVPVVTQPLRSFLGLFR